LQSNIGMYPIHRDLISENLLWKQSKLAGVIDFEHVSETNDPIVKDLAVTVQYCCRDNKVRHRLDIDSASRFLQAYREHRPLSDKEVVLIPDLITAGFAEDFVFAFWAKKRSKKGETIRRGGIRADPVFKGCPVEPFEQGTNRPIL